MLWLDLEGLHGDPHARCDEFIEHSDVCTTPTDLEELNRIHDFACG